MKLRGLLRDLKWAFFKEEGFRFNTAANYVTLSRVVMLPFILWSFTKKWECAAITLLALCIFSDFADGKVAARYGRSEVGKIFDPIADKLVFCFIVGWLWPIFLSKGELGLQITLEWLLFSLGFMKVFVKSNAKRNITLGSNIFGKLKFTFQSIEMTCLFFVKFDWYYKHPNLVKDWMVDPSVIKTVVWISIALAFASLTMHGIKGYREYNS